MKQVIEVKRREGKPSQVVVGDVINSLDNYLPEGKRVIIITDGNVHRRYKEIINRYDYCLIGLGETIKTMTTVNKLYAELLERGADRTTFIVGIGGGKALDFAKFSAHLLKLPFVSVPTSTSNDGFCSPNSSLIVDGKRKTVKASIPFGVVADLEVVRESPQICLYSGVGDMVSKITALYDWKQAAERKLDRYNDFASLLSYNSLTLLFNKHSTDINEPSFQRSLVNSLLTSGIAMEIAGSSRPASGSEHLISHGLDAVSRRPRMHGLQVGVATYLCALLQNNPSTANVRDILSITGFFNYVKQDPLSKEDFINALQMAPGIKANYYTVLSEPDSFARALQFIDRDPILNQIIRY